MRGDANRRRRVAGVIAGALSLAALAVPGPAAAASYGNDTPIASNMFSSDVGPLFPYPASIYVEDVPGRALQVRATLREIAYQDIDELDILLVAPNGDHTSLISDVCKNVDTVGDPVTLTLDDDASQVLPTDPATCSLPALSGTYKPTNLDGSDPNYSPAPPPPHPAAMSALRGSPASGMWHLYAYDDVVAVGGSILGGWSLDIISTARCGGRTGTSYATVGTDRRDVLRGTPGRDVFLGLGGNDVIRGFGGNDVICGGPGRDTILGGPGRDRIIGGPGHDRCVGGPGRDRTLSCERRRSI